MDADHLRAFARRDWAAATDAKLAYWAERYRRNGSVPARRAASVLLEHAQRLGVPLFDTEHRDADLAHHVVLRDRLDRAARALSNR